MRKNNNKGSSLILVIVLFAVIFTIGGVVVTTVSINYKTKVKESNKLQNLYESEAGLDIAYNIIIKNFEQGIASGKEAVKNIKDEDLEKLSAKEKRDLIDAIFKEGVRKVVNPSEFKNCIENRTTNPKYVLDYKQIESNKRYKYVSFNNESDDPQLTCDDITKDTDENKIKLKVNSTFETKQAVSDSNKNRREIEVIYEVGIPNYEDTIVTDVSKKIVYPKELKGKIMAIDGNMTTDESGSLNINLTGDVFVKGDNVSDMNAVNNAYKRVYKKYNGGVAFNSQGSTNLIMKGDFITSNTLNLANNIGTTNLVINGNVYSGNIYIGKKDGNYASGNTMTANGEVIVDNDLTLKANNSNITINKFYGINDKNDATEDFDSNGNLKTTTRTSSSIIVNGNEKSSIKINEEAYIMGTAYINAQNSLGKSYKTAESVAVKGNYIAYTKPIKEFSQADFEMYGLLQLVEGLTPEEKEKYFKLFVEQYAKQDEINEGGVTLPIEKTYSAGSIVYKKDNNLVVEKSKYDQRTQEVIETKQEEYAGKVYCMNSIEGSGNLKTIYDKLGEYQKTVSSKIDFNIMKNFDSKNNDNRLVLNNDPAKTIVLTDKVYEGKLDEIVVNVDKNKRINGLILTNGNVRILSENISYNGAIVSTKDLNIISSASSNINLVYDENVINSIISKYSNELKGVIESSNDNKLTSSDKDEEDNIVESNGYDYDAKQYIKAHNWKILK